MTPLTVAAAVALVLSVGDGDAIDRALRGDFNSPPAAAPTPGPLLAPPSDPTACEAASLAYLVGRPRTEIPVPVDPSRRRVSCTTCPVTQDHRPERTDILFDQATGLITAVKCG
jgi:hypothetical protein